MNRGRWHRWELASVAAVAAIPYVHAVSLWRAGWLPLGDNANIAIRAADVGTRTTPLVGMPSGIVGFVGDSEAAHPGPLVFWALGPWVRAFGPRPLALLVGCATVIALAAVAALWSARRAAGPRGLAVAAVLLVAVLALTPFQLVAPLNPALALVPAIAGLLAGVAVAGGDRWALPVLVAGASFAVQADVVYGPVVAPAVVVALVLGHRRRTAGGDRRPIVAAAVVAVIAWSGPVLDLVVHAGGNLRETLRTSAAAELGSQGLPGAADAVRSMLHPLGWLVWASLGQVPSGLVAIAVTVGWVVVVARSLRRGWPDRPPSIVPATAVAAAAALGAAVGGALAPAAAGRNALYLSGVIVAGFVVTFAGAVVVLGDRPVERRLRRGASAAIVVVGLVVVGLRAVVGSPLDPGTGSVPELADAAAGLAPGRLLLVSTGGPTSQAVLRGVGLVLEQRGFAPCYPPDQDVYVGHRTCEVDEAVDRLVLTRPLVGDAPAGWELLASVGPRDPSGLDGVRTEVAAALRSQPIALTHQSSDAQIGEVLASSGALSADELLDEAAITRLGAELRADPRQMAELPDAVLATLAEEGIVARTAVDVGLWRRFLDATDEDQLELWYVPADR